MGRQAGLDGIRIRQFDPCALCSAQTDSEDILSSFLEESLLFCDQVDAFQVLRFGNRRGMIGRVSGGH